MDKIKILVAQHKAANVFKNDVYTPIQVGKAVSKVDLGILGDDTGDNISKLNPFYCELTAQYWAWKNIHDVEYIGLCHYRRYFETEYTVDNIDREIMGYDVILVRRVVRNVSLLWHQSNTLIPDDIALFHLYMTKRFANNIEIYNAFYQNTNKYNPTNMFVCKKTLFDKFCEWQFEILEDMRKILPKSPYSHQQRIGGYLAEMFWSFYAYQKRLRVKEVPCVSMIGQKYHEGLRSRLRDVRNNIHFYLNNKQLYAMDPATKVGFIKDGLMEKVNEVIECKKHQNFDAL